MSQPTTTTEQLAPTQYVVPVQALQGLPKLAKATTPPPATPAETAPKNWLGIAFVVAVWTAAISLGFDVLYGGADIRKVQAQAAIAKQQAQQLQQQNAELQQLQLQQAQAISTAQAALGCPTGGHGQ